MYILLKCQLFVFQVFQLCKEERHLIYAGELFKCEGNQWKKVRVISPSVMHKLEFPLLELLKFIVIKIFEVVVYIIVLSIQYFVYILQVNSVLKRINPFLIVYK